MWQRLTERARRVVYFAQEEAQAVGESYVSTEHLLLGVVRESDTVAVRLLASCDISPQKVREAVTRQMVTSAEAARSQDMQLTPRAKRVIDLAYDEARQLGNNYIGTEHLLLGLVREAEGVAGRVLAELGVALVPLREAVRTYQDQNPQGVRTPRPGERAMAQPMPGESSIWAFADAASYRAFADAWAARDGVGLRELVADEVALPLAAPVAVKCLVGSTLAGDLTLQRVRVRDGAKAGRAFWIDAASLTDPEEDTEPFPPPLSP